MFEMAYEFDKRLKYVGNDVCIQEMAQVFDKRLLNYVGNGSNMFGNDLII